MAEKFGWPGGSPGGRPHADAEIAAQTFEYEPSRRTRAQTIRDAFRSPFLRSHSSSEDDGELLTPTTPSPARRHRGHRRTRSDRRREKEAAENKRAKVCIGTFLALAVVAAGIVCIVIFLIKPGKSAAAEGTVPPINGNQPTLPPPGSLSDSLPPTSTPSTAPSSILPSPPTPPGPDTSSLIPSGTPQAADMQKALLAHNQDRALHGAPPMTWNESLAAGSQEYINHCVFKHSGEPYGECLYGTSGKGGVNVTAAVQAWYSEGKDYDYSNPGFSSGTGHFTQVVWVKSISLGCAVAENCGMYLCRYLPQGNFGGQYKENVLPEGTPVGQSSSSGTHDSDDDSDTAADERPPVSTVTRNHARPQTT